MESKKKKFREDSSATSHGCVACKAHPFGCKRFRRRLRNHGWLRYSTSALSFFLTPVAQTKTNETEGKEVSVEGKAESSNNDDLPVFVKWFEFLEWLLPATDKFPKKARFSFSQRIEGIALDVIEDLIEAQYSKEKRAILKRVNLRLEKLRVLLRLSHKLRYLPHNGYEHASRSINEAGRMIGGWLKQQEQR
jgi:hypothetical protein